MPPALSLGTVELISATWDCVIGLYADCGAYVFAVDSRCV